MSRLINPLQLGLTDPLTFLDVLAAGRRRAEESAISGGRPKKPKQQQQPVVQAPQGATPPTPATSTTTTPATPAAVPTRVTTFPLSEFDNIKALREAAKLTYQKELEALTAPGVNAKRLSQRRNYERYHNRLGQLQAIENKLRREDERPAKRAARVAADAERKRLLAERLAARDATRAAQRSAAGDRSYTSVEDIRARGQGNRTPAPVPPQSTQTAEPVNPSEQSLREMSQVPYRTPIASGTNWLDDAIRSQIDLIRQQTKSTPTGQLSGLVEPQVAATPAPAPAPAPAPSPPLEQLVAALPPDQQKMIRDQMAQREMLAEMERMSTAGYGEIANRGLGENLLRSADDTVRMLESIGDIPVLGTALRTLFGPGGVAGAPLPQELAQREIERARTPEERATAQARAAQAAMQGGLQDLLGGAAQGIRSQPRTIPTPAGRPVIDNPQVVGQTKPRAAYTPEGAIRVTPGQTGQVVDMPQVPGRGPYQAGLPEATAPTSGPMGMKVSDTVPPINQSQSPIGTIRRPYLATETLADGQGLLPGIRASEAPLSNTPEQALARLARSPLPPDLSQLVEPPLLPGMPSPTVTPKVPTQIQEARNLQRRVAQGRAANEQIARQLAASRAADTARADQNTFMDALSQLLQEALQR